MDTASVGLLEFGKGPNPSSKGVVSHMATATPTAPAVKQNSVDIAARVNAFTKSKAQWAKTLMANGIVAKSGGWNRAELKKSVTGAGMAPIAMGLASTRSGYSMIIGVGEIALYATQYAIVEAVHSISRAAGTIGYGIGVIAGWASKSLGEKIKTKSQNLTCKVTEAANTIDTGATVLTTATVNIAQEETTVKFVNRTAATFSIIMAVNLLSRGRIAKLVTKLPRVGKVLATGMKGGKPTLIALGVIILAGVLFTIGTHVAKGESITAVAEAKTAEAETVIEDAKAAAEQAREAAADATKAAELNTESVAFLAEAAGFDNARKNGHKKATSGRL